ncbi:MAG: phosphatidylinositol mannoside acyltransferase [Corynebacterium sp.]|nr:phosphatidylinositol mannoside acyltransferase [Corynebacterium sp.]
MRKLRDSLPQVAQQISSMGYSLGWTVVKWLPASVASRLFDRIADVLARRAEFTWQLRLNLGRIVGPENVTEELVRNSLRSYFRYWQEAFRLPRIHKDPILLEQLERGVEGIEYLDTSIREGKGVVLALTHSGNWDMAGVFLVHHCGAFTTVAERLKPESLYTKFVRFRESLGFEILAHQGNKDHPMQRLRHVLEGGGIVCLLSERDLRRTGVAVAFFGEEANMAAGPAKLAQQTGAALHAVHCFYADDADTNAAENDKAGDDKRTFSPWRITITPPIKVTNTAETTQKIAREFENFLRRRPQDWHMLQPLWNADINSKRQHEGSQNQEKDVPCE